MIQEAAFNFEARRNCAFFSTGFIAFRGVLDQDNGTVEIPVHPRSHAHEVPPQVSYPEELGLEGERWAIFLQKPTETLI